VPSLGGQGRCDELCRGPTVVRQRSFSHHYVRRGDLSSSRPTAAAWNRNAAGLRQTAGAAGLCAQMRFACTRVHEARRAGWAFSARRHDPSTGFPGAAGAGGSPPAGTENALMLGRSGAGRRSREFSSPPTTAGRGRGWRRRKRRPSSARARARGDVGAFEQAIQARYCRSPVHAAAAPAWVPHEGRGR